MKLTLSTLLDLNLGDVYGQKSLSHKNLSNISAKFASTHGPEMKLTLSTPSFPPAMNQTAKNNLKNLMQTEEKNLNTLLKLCIVAK